MQDSVLRRKSMMEPDPSRTVTKYEAIFPDANIDLQIDEKNPHLPEQDSTDVTAGYDAFVAHKWSRN